METCAKQSFQLECKSADGFEGVQQGFSSPFMPLCSFNTIQAKLEGGIGKRVGWGVTEEEKEVGWMYREGAGV